MSKKLADYVDSTLDEGYSLKEAGDRLKQEGYDDKEIEDALSQANSKHTRHTRLLIALAGFAAFIVLGILIYVFVIVPMFVPVPAVQPPLISQAVTSGTQLGAPDAQPALSSTHAGIVSTAQVEYVLTLLGAYKLHTNPLTGKPPELDVIVTDTGQSFAVAVQGGKVQAAIGTSEHPDVVIRATYDAIVSLNNAKNATAFKERAAQLLAEREQRGLTGELKTSTQDMLLKGYLGLYEENKGLIADAGITGHAVDDLQLGGFSLIGMFWTVVIVWAALLVRMGVHR